MGRLSAMNTPALCIIGLGYVGLPLAHAFAKNGYSVTGFDINEGRIEELKSGHDSTGEITDADLQASAISYTTDPSTMKECDVVIVALPTPVDSNNKPDLTILESASKTIGANLKHGAIVVYESTVYPGVTEDVCGPILEQESGLKSGSDFFLGYSPERINPGDKEHTVDKIIKVVAGQDEITTDTLCDLYGSIVTAGIHRAANIKTAEMAKAIENAQRDLNIAYVNEIAMLCHKIGIDSSNVLEAAGTKWNFLPFKPGLVGGHCIGVDPYYLVEKADQLGMETHVISAGRAVNDNMAELVAKEQVMGMTFKENVPDTRNSQSSKVIKALKGAGCDATGHDPHADAAEIFDSAPYDAIVLLVPHKEYIEMGTQAFIDATVEGAVIYDVKSILDKDAIENSGRTYLCL